ncbi:MAG: hypothetical protein LBM98_07935 [Oscillospiraceae bacterium]|nr:hypothetical protein [Oscillospiraceae bacterium]
MLSLPVLRNDELFSFSHFVCSFFRTRARGRAGLKPAPTGVQSRITASLRNPRPNPIPLCGGVPPQARGGFPRRAQPTSKPTSLIFDI